MQSHGKGAELRDGADTAVPSGYHDYQGRWVDVPPETLGLIHEAMAPQVGDGPLVLRRGEVVPLTEPVEVLCEDGSVRESLTELPADLPFGYHQVRTPSGERDLIVGPRDCYLPESLRSWGWALQLYALWSKGSLGIGDLGDLRIFGRWAAGHGASLALINPLHAALPVSPYENSPYYPSSRCFLDPLYVDIRSVPGISEIEVPDARALDAGGRIVRDSVFRIKSSILERVWEVGDHRQQAERYLAERGAALQMFATYSCLAENHGADHREWPAGLRHPSSSEVAVERERGRDRILFHAWVQSLLDRQLAEAGKEIGVVNDLAIGVAPFGADAWMWQDTLATSVTIGAPPDDYNREGQNWGILGFDPSALRAEGYRPFVEMVRASMRHAAGIRFDHVMGLFRLFWIPEGIPATRGGYVRYPAHDLITILALESQRAQAFVIGEDLGTVEEGVREEMAATKMLSYRLLWFLDHNIDELSELSMAAANTHDLPTTRGLWEGTDLARQRELGLDPAIDFAENMLARIRRHLGVEPDISVEDLVMRTTAALASAESAVVTVAIDDVAGTAERYNYPGTSGELNWTTRLPISLEDLVEQPLAGEIARVMRDAGR